MLTKKLAGAANLTDPGLRTERAGGVAAKRQNAFDIAKGFSIILVVFAHTLVGVHGAIGETALGRSAMIFIYTFHMAVFFMASGVFARPALVEPLGKFAMRLARRIVWPYLLWSAVLMYAHYFMSDYTNAPATETNPLVILYSPPAVMWFLYALFLGFVVARIIRPLPALAQLLVGFAAIASAYVVSNVLNIPLFLRSIGLFIPAVVIGRDRVMAAARNPYLLLVSLAVMAGTGVMAWQEGQAPLVEYPGWQPPYLPAEFAGSLLVLAGAMALDRFPNVIATVLGYLGRRTMPIFVTHILLTAGLRIALRLAGIENGAVVLVVGTIAAIALPIIAYEIAVRMRLARILGWL